MDAAFAAFRLHYELGHDPTWRRTSEIITSRGYRMLSEAFGGAADVAEKRARVQADNAEGPSAAIDALRATPPFDEAEAQLLEEIIGFPDRPRPLIEFALMADQAQGRA